MGLSDSVLVADLRRFWERTSGTRLRRLATCLRVPGVQAVVVLRFGQWALRRPGPLRMALAPLYLLGFRRMRGRWGIEIPRRTSIGPGLYIGHAGGIVVSPEAVIGARVALSHGVTIGVANRGGRRGAPRIEDAVYIAPGAHLSGPITIGYRARIGPNAVVFRDVPARARALAGEPVVLLHEPDGETEGPEGTGAG